MITIIQFNSRSLTKSNLIMFKDYLHQHKPLIALLSETYWKKSFSVKFKQYHTIIKNRENSPGGGVAILVHKSLQFTPLVLPSLTTIEAVAVTINVEVNKKNELIDIISVYIPNGNNCSEDELQQLTQGSNSIIIGGDFNAHHYIWEPSCHQSNQSGRAVANLLERNENIMISTPPT